MLLAKRPSSMNSILLYPWEYSFYHKACKLDEVKKKESPSASKYVCAFRIHILPVGEWSFNNREWMVSKWPMTQMIISTLILHTWWHLLGEEQKRIMKRTTDYKHWLPLYYYYYNSKGLCIKAKSLLCKNRLIK